MVQEGVGTVTVEASNVSYNTVVGNGGALYVMTIGGGVGDLRVDSGSRLRNNRAANTGGALFVSVHGNVSSVSIDGAELSGNTATGGQGGAVYMGTRSTLLEAVVSGGAALKANTAGGDGGAVYLSSETAVGLVLVTGGSKLSGNHAGYGGGALHVEVWGIGGIGLVEVGGGSELWNNSAGGGASSSGNVGNGGALCLWASRGSIGSLLVSGGSSLRGNSAAFNGGAVYAFTESTIGGFAVTGSGTAVVANIGQYGGGVYLQAEGDGGIPGIKLSNGALAAHNRANNSGGYLYAYASSGGVNAAVTANGSVLSNVAGLNGGGLHLTGSIVSLAVTGSSLCQNEATLDSGGAVYAYARADLESVSITGDSKLDLNRAGTHGGAIYAFSSGGSLGALLVGGSSSLGRNVAGVGKDRRGSGGALCVQTWGSILAVDITGGSRLYGNNCTGAGGAVVLQALKGNVSVVTLDGGVMVYGNARDLAMLGCCTTALHSLASEDCLWRALYEAEFGGGAGGASAPANDAAQALTRGYKAVFARRWRERAELRKRRCVAVGGASRFENNSAGGDGGALYVGTASQEAAGSISIGGASTLSGNNATSGGALLVAGYAYVSLGGGSILSGNRAARDGGGAAFTHLPPQLLLHEATVANNTAERGSGGAFHITAVNYDRLPGPMMGGGPGVFGAGRGGGGLFGGGRGGLGPRMWGGGGFMVRSFGARAPSRRSWSDGGACGQPPAASDGVGAAPASHTCRIILVAGERLTGGEVRASLPQCDIHCWAGAAAAPPPTSAAATATVRLRLGGRLLQHIADPGSGAVLRGVTWNASAPRWGGDTASGPPGASSDSGGGSDGSSAPLHRVAAADDWGLDLVGVPRLQLVDSVVRGLPLSSVGPLLQCLGCGRLAVSNLTLQDLAPPPAISSGDGGTGADGSDGFGGGDEAPVWYGAARFSNLTSATLDGVRCSNVTGSQGWACMLLQLQRTGPGTVALRHSRFVGNMVAAPQPGPPAAPDLPPATASPDELLPSAPPAAPVTPPAGAPAPPTPLGPPGGAGVEGSGGGVRRRALLGEAGAVPGAEAPSGQAGGATAAAATATDADAPPAAAVDGNSREGLPSGLLHSQGYGAVLVSYTDVEAEAGSDAAAAVEDGVGGGDVAAAATVSVYDCVFRSNAGGCGGGLAVLDPVGVALGQRGGKKGRRSAASNPRRPLPPSLPLLSAVLSLTSCTLASNTAGGAGGAVAVFNPAGAAGSHVFTGVDVANCSFFANRAGSGSGTYSNTGSQGGALFMWYQPQQPDSEVEAACILRAEASTFKHNACNGGNGGALMLISCGLRLARCAFESNTATLSGGAVACLHVRRSSAVSGLAGNGGGSGGGHEQTAARRRRRLQRAEGTGGGSNGGGGSCVESGAPGADAAAVAAGHARQLRQRRLAQLLDGGGASGAYVAEAAAAPPSPGPAEPASSAPVAASEPPGSPAATNAERVTAGAADDAAATVAQSLGPGCGRPLWQTALLDCNFSRNTAQLEFGGGLYLDAQAHGLVLLRDCRLQDNVVSGQHGGALFLAAGGACSGAALIDSNLTGNAAAVASAGAAYVLLGGGALGVLEGVAIASSCAATRGGGAVLDVRQNGTLKMRGCVLDGNTAGSGGGGGAVLLVQPDGGAALEGCAMHGNAAAGSGGGGGLYVRAGCGARVSVLGTNLTANDAGGSGGAVYVMYGYTADDGVSAAAGGAGQQQQGCDDGGAAELSGLVAGGNRAGGYGGAVFLAPGSAARLAGATLYGNTAGGSGGGVAALNCSYLAISDGSISGSTAAAGSGGGLYAAGCGRVLLQRGSMWRNEAVAGKGGGIYLAGPGNAADLLQLPSADAGATAAAAVTPAAAFTAAVVHRVWLYGNRAAQGGGVFCSGGVAAAFSQCDLALGNAAPDGPALASTQRCGAVANTSVPPGAVQPSAFPDPALQPWALAWAFLDLAARQRCSALLLSDSLLPHIRVARGCSDDADGVVRAADAKDSAGAAAIARQDPAQAATDIRFTMQRLFQVSAASAAAAAAAATATAAASSGTLPSPPPARRTNSTTTASDPLAEATVTQYDTLMAGLSQCWDGPALSARERRAVVKAHGAYLGLPPTKLELMRTGVVAEELARQGDLQLRRLVLGLHAGRDFNVSVQLYDKYSQPVTSAQRSPRLLPPTAAALCPIRFPIYLPPVIAPSIVTLALLPVPPGGGRYDPAAADGSRPWRHNGSVVYLDAGFKKSLSVPVEAGVATWRKVAARGWPGRYSLTFALLGGEVSQAQVSDRTAYGRPGVGGAGKGERREKEVKTSQGATEEEKEEGGEEGEEEEGEQEKPQKGGKEAAKEAGLSAIGKPKKYKVETGDVVKVIIVHIQYFVIVTHLNIDYPSLINRCQAAFSALTGTENYITYSPSCLRPAQDSVGQAQIQLLAGLLTPCAVVLVSMLTWASSPSSSATLRTDVASGATVVDLQELLSLGPAPSYATDATTYATAASAGGSGGRDGWPGRSCASLPRPMLGLAVVNIDTVASTSAGCARTWTAAHRAPRASGTGSGPPGKVAPVPPLPEEQPPPHPGAQPGSDPRPPPVPSSNDFVSTPFRLTMQSSSGVGLVHIGDRGGDDSAAMAGGGSSTLAGDGPSTRISGGYDGSRSSMMTWRNRGALGSMYSSRLPRRSLAHIGSVALRSAVGRLGRMGTAAVSALDRPFSGNSTLSTVDREMRLSEQLAIVLMAAVFILYPAWASAALSTFACYRIDRGGGAFAEMQQATWQYGYWVRNMNQECYAGSHLDVYLPIGLAAVVVFCLAPPLASFLVVRRIRGNLDNPRTQRVYGFLYKRYRPRFMWWETVLQVETLALVTVEVLGRGLPVAFQSLLLLAAFMAVSLVNTGCAALRSRLLARMEFMSLGTLSLTITLSLYFTVNEPLEGGSQEVLAVLIAALNVAVLAFFLCVVARPYWPATYRWLRARTKALKARLTPCAGACPRPSCTHRGGGGGKGSSSDAEKGAVGKRQQQGAPAAGAGGKPRGEELGDGSGGAAAALQDSSSASRSASSTSVAQPAQPATPAQGLQPAGPPGQGMTRCGQAVGWDSTSDASSRSGTVGVHIADR
ncbi:hypothetical protein TSOC_007015 [Tetrabaena socialis]|uniref:Uncharacterized protein n=1 Tax=Tetrabaena socialis TaxID=47790 RepID=A0A2J8A247_9CHLO|nr:hypothetical protein TSOC_007015 [Tetrabaena socialis]|eukprot:PNH06575.1 hypothetical protein TSOC_007015 [Tetrabaena socialis]